MAIARRAIQGLPKDFAQTAANQLATLYAEAAKTIKERAEQRLLRGKGLTAEATRSRALLIEVQAILAQLDSDAAKLVSDMIPKAYRVGLTKANRGLAELGFKAGPVPFDLKFHGNAIDLLMIDMQGRLLEVSKGVMKNFRTTLTRTQTRRALDKLITKEIATGSIAGKTVREVGKGIEQTIINEFGDKPLTINGRQYNVQKYAELVARTKTREAVTNATVNRMVETGNDLVVVTAHGAKDGCGFFEGKVFSISGTSERYPPLNSIPRGGPPFHPRCVHNLAPFVDSRASGAEKRAGARIDKSARKLIQGQRPFKEFEKLAAA